MNRFIRRLFERGNVLVNGERGSGKDVLIGNVYVRNRIPYVSNQDYGGNCLEQYLPAKFDMNGNTYKDLINDTCAPYEFPYPESTHVIISDGGIYFPSQYCNELNRDYKGQPMFAALSRQLGEGCHVHANTQAYGRLWDKMREQCVRYLNCEWCIHVLGLVIQRVIYYDKADSCAARIKPCRVPIPKMGDKNARMQARIYRDQFFNQHGTVRAFLLVYRERSKHDTYQFKYYFKEVKTIEEEIRHLLRPRGNAFCRRHCKRFRGS